MKKVFAVVSLFLVIACSNGNTASIEGTAAGVADNTSLYLQELGENNKRTALDTAVVLNEKFSFDTNIAGTGILVLSDKTSNNQLLLVRDDTPLNITFYKDSIASSKVTGGEPNKLFAEYRYNSQKIALKKKQLIQDMQRARKETDGIMVKDYRDQIVALDKSFIDNKRQLIRDNPNSIVAAIALSDLTNAKVLKIEEAEKIYSGLAEEIKTSVVGTSIKNYLARLKSNRIASGLADVGNKAPDFTAKTPDGDMLSLKETLGKFTIVDFWASWCRPCRMENPNVVNVYNKYHDKGLNIISVSLDRPGQETRWKKAIKDDKMDWYHVSNLKYWQDPIPRSYGVRAIPTTFLLDDRGVIIAKNLRGASLGAKMEELLGS